MAGSQRLGLPRHALDPDEVHVWHVFVDQVDDPDLLLALRGILTPEEQVREKRYAHERDRRQFFLARVLARTVLGSYLGRSRDDLQFVTSPYGKPTLVPSAGCSCIHFNLTHSHGLIACAVSPSRKLGIDVEDASRPLAYLDLAERYFAPPEAAYLRMLGADDQRSAFFSVWTLKEAFVKALGQGLTYPLDAFSFDLDRDRLLRFHPLGPDVPPHWQFFQFQLGPRHRGAVAVQHLPEQPLARSRLFDWSAQFLTRAGASTAR